MIPILRKKKIILCCAVFLFLAVISAWRIYRVNSAFPQTEKIFIEPGEAYPVDENFILCTNSAEWLDRQQLEDRYGDGIGLIRGYDYKGVIVEVTLKNISTEPKTIELYKFYIETDTYYDNGLDMEMYLLDNSASSVITLRGGEERILYLPYSMSDVQFTGDEWKRVEKNKFYLVNERYPRKVYWQI